MADTVVASAPNVRFFCHRCLVEFQGIEQDYLCPYCQGGFIEQLGPEREGGSTDEEYNDAAMSNLDDNMDDMSNMEGSDDFQRNAPPMLNDFAFLLSGARLQGTGVGRGSSNSSTTGASNNSGNGANNPGRRPTLMEELVWMMSAGNRSGPGAMPARTPFVLVGTPGDYVFGGEGLDAVVTQLLGQLEHAGPPPLPRERLAAIPAEQVTEEQAAANIVCSVCWENFQLGETTSRLECEHVFHQACITPWLQLHATCPICRRSLLPPAAPAPPAGPQPAQRPARAQHHRIRLGPRLVIRRSTGPHGFIRRMPTQTHTWDINTSTSGSSPTSTVTTGGVWAPQARATNSSGSTNSSSSLNSNDRDLQYNTDIDYD